MAVIAKELDKDESLRKYFDNWGNECYVFSAELWGQCYTNCYKDSKPRIIQQLDINVPYLKEKNVRYVFYYVESSTHEPLATHSV